MGNNLYLLKKGNCCCLYKGEKYENEYKDCLHRLYIKNYICTINKKNVRYDKRLLREQYKNQTFKTNISVKGLGVMTGELEYFIGNAWDNISKNSFGYFPLIIKTGSTT